MIDLIGSAVIVAFNQVGSVTAYSIPALEILFEQKIELLRSVRLIGIRFPRFPTDMILISDQTFVGGWNSESGDCVAHHNDKNELEYFSLFHGKRPASPYIRFQPSIGHSDISPVPSEGLLGWLMGGSSSAQVVSGKELDKLREYCLESSLRQLPNCSNTSVSGPDRPPAVLHPPNGSQHQKMTQSDRGGNVYNDMLQSTAERGCVRIQPYCNAPH